VYRGIDLRWQSREKHLEYEFRLAPGADPKTIRIRFSGGHGVRMISGFPHYKRRGAVIAASGV
jgi:hypothetical protein